MFIRTGPCKSNGFSIWQIIEDARESPFVLEVLPVVEADTREEALQLLANT